MTTRLSLAIVASVLLTATSGDAAEPQTEASAQGANTLTVLEEPKVSRVHYHGNRAVNDRDLTVRSGIKSGEPLNEPAIESGRRRLIDFYHEEGFKQAVVETVRGIDSNPNYVIFRIVEGPRERTANRRGRVRGIDSGFATGQLQIDFPDIKIFDEDKFIRSITP